MEEHPCTGLELIEEIDSNPWFCVCSLCMSVECYAHECLLPVMHFLYMLCMNDFLLSVRNLRKEVEEMSFNCFSI